ncbi:MAG: DUF2179 domain-containing protein [Gracilibacteraceae bacterium]|nr:DUF2179 domain-containing protein [Gracilibacteraceae bacterium]
MTVAWKLILFIVGINILYVAATTIRMILMIKGMRKRAALLSVVEVFIYISGLSVILSNLNSPWNLIAYCGGYGAGVYIGCFIEEKMALGYVTAHVIINSAESELTNLLRQHRFGVTSWIGEGRDGPRLIMMVLAKRSRQKELERLIDSSCPHAFVFFDEPKNMRGGFWSAKLR